MTNFQIGALIFLAILFMMTVAASVRRKASPRVTFGWGLLWIVGAIAVIQPELTAKLAKALGIGRGTDLVFYVAILAGLWGFFMVYLRLRRMEQALTTVVRELAVRFPVEADRNESLPLSAISHETKQPKHQ